MKASENCQALIQHFESVNNSYSDSLYVCTSGNLTIGYGHTVKPSEYFGGPITRKEALDLLLKDIESASKLVEDSGVGNVTQGQFDALTCLAFYVQGRKIDSFVGGFSGNPVIANLKTGKVQLASSEFSKLIYSNGRIIPRMIPIRKAEAALFLTGVFL